MTKYYLRRVLLIRHQIPQLWQEYIPEESPQELAQRRAREIAATLEAKRAAAATARQAQPVTFFH
jgi:hypothetical protein